ncbi:MAG: insulinase family protein [Bdellovibrionales bacterium]|nr:insulinase family protein [Oligoflexia bacterium]
MKNIKIQTVIILFTLFSSSFAHAVEIYFEKDASLPLVYVSAAFRGGATQDPENKSGLTDLMGKLMLRGTKNKSKQQIDLALDQLGASLEFDTRLEFIAFRGIVLSENLPQFLGLLDEILVTPSFRTQDLEKLKKEQSSQLLDELAQDRNLIKLRFEETFFKGHPYSKPVSGKIKDIQSITAADLQKQYQKLINETQMVVLGAGDTNQNAFNTFLQDMKSKRNQVSALTPLPDFTTEPKKLRVMIFDKPDRTQTQVMIGQKGVSIKEPQIDALQLANHAFGGSSFQARLMVELRVKRGWTYGAGSNFRLGSKNHSWRLAFFPKNADTAPAIKVALSMVSDLKKSGITEAEFNSSKQGLVNGAGFNFNTPQKRLENKLIEVLYGLPEGYFKNYANRLSALSLVQVNSAIQKFITPDQLFVGVVGTSSVSRSEIAKALSLKETDVEVQDYQKE